MKKYIVEMVCNISTVGMTGIEPVFLTVHMGLGDRCEDTATVLLLFLNYIPKFLYFTLLCLDTIHHKCVLL